MVCYVDYFVVFLCGWFCLVGFLVVVFGVNVFLMFDCFVVLEVVLCVVGCVVFMVVGVFVMVVCNVW